LDRVLGLFILAVYVVVVVGLAGLVTYGVIKIFPTRNGPGRPPDEPSDDGSGEPRGRLFRRSKRATAG
jgi:hypothetical protein